uniref:Reverse transcriptase domain-containing protein n=1 Tax=Tanacetum cinerariifolium TaxID=118510 RepID=A0A6L2KIE7_TANCI|nr:reverse transcriptase domain-containing protein [Tanacetum cinerariifolium]
MEDDFKPAVQHQRRVNPKIHEVIKKGVIKLLDAGLIYPISDSPWVSPVHCVPKKGGMTVVENEDNELIPTRLVTGWRVFIDYRKLNDATRKDHFPLPFMDQMLERLARNKFYCFLDGFSEYFQIPIDPQDQEKTTFPCPYGTFAYRRMPFGLCNASGTFQRCMMAIFHDMNEKTMEVFMDDFLVFGAKNLAADHLSKLENPHQDELENKEITETFPRETLGMIAFRGDSSTPWIALDLKASRARCFVHRPLETDGEAMINSIKNGDQPLPRVTEVSIAETTSTEQPPLEDKSMWSDQEKRVQKIDRLARSLLIQGLSNDIYSLIDNNKTAKDLWDALARHMLGSEYGEQDMKAAIL